MSSRIQPWVNSYQDYLDALELALDRTDVDAFLSGSVDQPKREAALIQAFHAINRMLFLCPEIPDRKERPFKIMELTETERGILSASFLYALNMAQILEADSLLGGGASAFDAVVEQKRRAGILQETVGESTTKFSAMPISSQAVRRRTTDTLMPWLYREFRIGRA